MADAHKNFAYSKVATAPSPAASGTSLVVTASEGALFPAVSFNATIWPASVLPSAANAEIVRVTNISTDTFTIARSQEGTSARTIIVGDQIAASITNKVLTDIESDITLKQNILYATNAQAAAYTIALSDVGKLVEISNASPVALTVPPNSTTAFTIGQAVHIIQTGAGLVTLTPGAGVTINASPGLKLGGQWAVATLIKRATDTWIAMGNLSA